MGELVRRHGTVIAASSEEIVVRLDADDEAAECGGCGSCAMKGLCRGRGTGNLDLPLAVRPGSVHQAGDRVLVAYSEPNAALAAMVMFLPPLIGLFAGGLAGNRFGTGDAALLVGCGAGLLAGLAVTYIAAKTIPSLRPTASLTDSVIESAAE